MGKNIRKIQWEKFWTRDFSLLRFWVYMDANRLDWWEKEFGVRFDHCLALPAGDGMTEFYHDKRELKQMQEKIYKKACKDYDTFEKYAKLLFGWMNEFLEFNRGMKKRKLEKLSRKELVDLWDEWYGKYLYWQVGTYFYFVIESIVSDNFFAYLKQIFNNEDELYKFFDLATTSIKMSSNLKKELHLLDLAIKVKENKISFNDAVSLLHIKFCWIPCYDIKDGCYNEEFFRKELSNLNRFNVNFLKIKKKKINSEYKKRKKNFNNFCIFLDNYKGKDRALVINKLIFYKDYRDDKRRQTGYYAKDFLNFLSKKMSISLKSVNYLTPDEIRSYLLFGKEVKNKKIFERIKSGFGLLSLKNGMELIPNEKRLNFFTNQNKNIKGMGVSKGVVDGKVVIVRHSVNLNKINKNSIIVAVSTHPEYYYAMKKCAAIVTDEGGMTSHAAILSREFKKPCVVGTKIASHILKDNDSVIVDANVGKIILKS